MKTVIPWWTKTGPLWYPLPRERPLDEDEASSRTAWAQGYREVRTNLRDSVTGRGYYKPKSSRHKKVVRKTMFEKKPPRRDLNIRTPFRDKARGHSTERVTGSELRNAPVATVDGHWSTATCGGRLSCSAMVRSTSQGARFGARGRDTVQHDCDLWWNWHGQGCASSGFPCWNRGCERSDAILGVRGAPVGR